jgi:hypothetical protein
MPEMETAAKLASVIFQHFAKDCRMTFAGGISGMSVNIGPLTFARAPAQMAFTGHALRQNRFLNFSNFLEILGRDFHRVADAFEHFRCYRLRVPE